MNSARNEVQIYKALGDSTRLKMVQRLAIADHALTIGELSAGLGVTRQGARKQLAVLVDAGVVHLRPQGRETEVRLDSQSLQSAREFIAHLEALWDKRLEALKKFVESDSSKSD